MRKYLTLFIAIIFLLPFSACTNESNNESQINDLQANQMHLQSFEISPKQVNEKLQNNEDFYLIDVRTVEERNDAQIPDDVDFIPTADIEAGIADFSKYNKDDEIVVYCRSGNRSSRVFKVMEELGFTNVKSMAGGINEWESLGYNTCSKLNNTC